MNGQEGRRRLLVAAALPALRHGLTLTLRGGQRHEPSLPVSICMSTPGLRSGTGKHLQALCTRAPVGLEPAQHNGAQSRTHWHELALPGAAKADDEALGQAARALLAHNLPAR